MAVAPANGRRGGAGDRQRHRRPRCRPPALSHRPRGRTAGDRRLYGAAAVGHGGAAGRSDAGGAARLSDPRQGMARGERERPAGRAARRDRIRAGPFVGAPPHRPLGRRRGGGRQAQPHVVRPDGDRDRHADGARGYCAAPGAAHRHPLSRLVPQSGETRRRAAAPSGRCRAAAPRGAALPPPHDRGAMIDIDDTALVADGVVNLFAAAGLLVVARANRRLDPHGALARRVAFALSFTAAFFFVRATAWLLGSIMLDRFASALAGAVPLAGLLVAEGLLRRHAPRWLKLALTAGFVLLSLGLVVPLPDTASGIAIFCVVFAGFGTIAW